MSYINYLEAVRLIDHNLQLCIPKLPQNEDNIILAEKKLQLYFPKSYREFLKKFGSLTIGSEDIFGLNTNNNFSIYIHENIICNTLDQRENSSNFPFYFIPIYELGNGEISCLDTSQINDEGECSIMAWYFGAVEKLAEDFGSYLLSTVIDEFSNLEKNGKEINWLNIKN